MCVITQQIETQSLSILYNISNHKTKIATLFPAVCAASKENYISHNITKRSSIFSYIAELFMSVNEVMLQHGRKSVLIM
jgi:hypothetical protein